MEEMGSVRNLSSFQVATPSMTVNQLCPVESKSSNPACTLCGNKIYPMELIGADEYKFHTKCFKCIHCRTPLTISTFFSHSGKLYCKRHYDKVENQDSRMSHMESSSYHLSLSGKTLYAAGSIECLSNYSIKSSIPTFTTKGMENDNYFTYSMNENTTKRIPTTTTTTSQLETPVTDSDIPDKLRKTQVDKKAWHAALAFQKKNASDSNGGFSKWFGYMKDFSEKTNVLDDDKKNLLNQSESQIYQDFGESSIETQGTGDIFAFMSLKPPTSVNRPCFMDGNLQKKSGSGLRINRSISIPESSPKPGIWRRYDFLFMDNIYIQLEPLSVSPLTQKSRVCSIEENHACTSIIIGDNRVEWDAMCFNKYGEMMPYCDGSGQVIDQVLESSMLQGHNFEVPEPVTALYKEFIDSKTKLLNEIRASMMMEQGSELYPRGRNEDLHSLWKPSAVSFVKKAREFLGFLTPVFFTKVEMNFLSRIVECLQCEPSKQESSNKLCGKEAINLINVFADSVIDCWRLYQQPDTRTESLVRGSFVSEIPRTPRNIESENIKFYSEQPIDLSDNVAFIYRDYCIGKEGTVNYVGNSAMSDDIIITLAPVIDSAKAQDIIKLCGFGGQINPDICVDLQCIIIRKRNARNFVFLTKPKSRGSIRLLGLKHVMEPPVKLYDCAMIPIKMKKISNPTIEDKLILMDELQSPIQYKFGILYCEARQITEEEMLSNSKGCPKYERLLRTMGNIIELSGFKGYSGSLDTKNNLTGKYSLYRKIGEIEIMFHVSTMLPKVEGDTQYIQKKRHIGNDIATVVYINGNDTFNPAIIRSQFLQTFIVVKDMGDPDDHDNPVFYIEVFSKTDLPRFDPPLISPPIFTSYESTSDFVIRKLIGAENAAHKSQAFQPLHYRTRSAIFDEFFPKHLGKRHKAGNIMLRNMIANVSASQQIRGTVSIIQRDCLL